VAVTTLPRDRAPRAALALLFAGFALVFSLFAKGHVDNLDAVQTVYAARSMWVRGDLGLPPAADAHSLPAEGMIANAPMPMGMRGAGQSFYVWFPIGHQLLLVPVAAVGSVLAEQLPGPEARMRALEGPGWGDLFWTMFAASFVPVLCAGGAAAVLFGLGRALGLTVDGALLVAVLSTAATQFWPMMVENLSDAPGLLCLFGAVLQVVRWLKGASGTRGLAWAGLWSGLAVLLRYPHALSVGLLMLFVAGEAWRRARSSAGGPYRATVWMPLAAMAGGGAPALFVLLLANYLRFGDALETGYGAAQLETWFNYPMALGVLFQFAAWGKGMLWLSPLLIPALYWAARRRSAGEGATGDRTVGWMIWALFLVPVAVFANTDGWQAGEVWGVRYVAPGIFLLVALGLSRARPWRGGRVARVVLAVFAAMGLAASATGLVAPVRGYLELAAEATRAHYREIGVDLQPGALPLHMFVEWKFSPLHGHWTYAALNLDGRMSAGGPANTTGPIFGVETPKRVRQPQRLADTGFRHWWWVWLEFVTGWRVWPWAAALFAAGLALLAWARRMLRRAEAPAACP